MNGSMRGDEGRGYHWVNISGLIVASVDGASNIRHGTDGALQIECTLHWKSRVAWASCCGSTG